MGECQVKNGRLAMLAFGGILHQQLLSKTPTLAFEKTKGLTMLDFSKVQRSTVAHYESSRSLRSVGLVSPLPGDFP